LAAWDRYNYAGKPVIFLVWVLFFLSITGCGKDARVGEKCSFDDQCAPEKGVICQGADGIGYGSCGCDTGSTWQRFLGKCIEDSFFEIKVGSGAEEEEAGAEDSENGKDEEVKRIFARKCQVSDDCESGTGLECVLGKCLCHPPGDTTVSWLWSKVHPDKKCRSQSAKRYFGAKIVCDEKKPKPAEYFIPPRVWWNEGKGRCRSLKERRTLHEEDTLQFTDWGDAVRDIL